jgi:hypothetical protein
MTIEEARVFVCHTTRLMRVNMAQIVVDCKVAQNLDKIFETVHFCDSVLVRGGCTVIRAGVARRQVTETLNVSVQSSHGIRDKRAANAGVVLRDGLP